MIDVRPNGITIKNRGKNRVCICIQDYYAIFYVLSVDQPFSDQRNGYMRLGECVCARHMHKAKH